MIFLSVWEKFLGTKFQRPAADAHQNLESLPAEDDVLDNDELRDCLKALRSGKATGWDNVPVEAYRGSVEATNELFRICRLMWRTEQIPPDLVRGVFMMIYKKGPRDDFANYRASASYAIHTSYYPLSLIADRCRYWTVTCQTPRLDSDQREGSETTFVLSAGLSPWCFERAGTP